MLVIIIMVPTKKNLLNINLVITMLYVAIFIGSLGLVRNLITFCCQKNVIHATENNYKLEQTLMAIIIFFKASWCGFVSDTVFILSFKVTYLEMEFRSKGGNISWLKGIQDVPAKIQNLLLLNKMLCHQPWYITQEHFQVS